MTLVGFKNKHGNDVYIDADDVSSVEASDTDPDGLCYVTLSRPMSSVSGERRSSFYVIRGKASTVAKTLMQALKSSKRSTNDVRPHSR